jgi:hypothetical protein
MTFANNPSRPPRLLSRTQFKHRIVHRNLPKLLHRRTRRHWKKLLHRARVPVQVFLQDLRLLLVRNRPQSVPLLFASPLQRDLSRRFRITHPLRAPSWRHQDLLAANLHQIHRRRKNLPRLSPPHLQQIDKSRAHPQPGQKSHRPVEKRLHRTRRPKLLRRVFRIHRCILAAYPHLDRFRRRMP